MTAHISEDTERVIDFLETTVPGGLKSKVALGAALEVCAEAFRPGLADELIFGGKILTNLLRTGSANKTLNVEQDISSAMLELKTKLSAVIEIASPEFSEILSGILSQEAELLLFAEDLAVLKDIQILLKTQKRKNEHGS